MPTTSILLPLIVVYVNINPGYPWLYSHFKHHARARTANANENGARLSFRHKCFAVLYIGVSMENGAESVIQN